MSATYNEFEPYAAQWIRNLAAAGHVAPGVVDERSIKEIQPGELGDGQVHLFAGIAVWSHALRMAGYPDSFAVWSASCPCQPFSSAGRGKGVDDSRHLWPDAFRLIKARRPVLVVGEQVASPDGLAWLDAVFADLEGAGYACRAVDICAAGFGAPHIRQRLYWAAVRLADAADVGLERWRSGEARDGRDAARLESERLRVAGRLGNADSEHARRDAGAGARAEGGPRLRPVGDEPRTPGAAVRLGYAGYAGSQGHAGDGVAISESRRLDANAQRPGPTSGFWSNPDWVACRDGKHRPVEPGTFPLAHGAAQRVGRLRAYGNALNTGQAQAFLEALKPCVAHLWGAS